MPESAFSAADAATIAAGRCPLGNLSEQAAALKQWAARPFAEVLAAAKAGDLAAMDQLGDRLHFGNRGAPHDDTLAVIWRQRAAAGNVAHAQCNLGLMHRDGQGSLVQNHAEAARLLGLAAGAGLASAQYGLGGLYYSGRGVREDKAEAKRLWELAFPGSYKADAALAAAEAAPVLAAEAQARKNAEAEATLWAKKTAASIVAALDDVPLAAMRPSQSSLTAVDAAAALQSGGVRTISALETAMAAAQARIKAQQAAVVAALQSGGGGDGGAVGERRIFGFSGSALVTAQQAAERAEAAAEALAAQHAVEDAECEEAEEIALQNAKAQRAGSKFGGLGHGFGSTSAADEDEASKLASAKEAVARQRTVKGVLQPLASRFSEAAAKIRGSSEKAAALLDGPASILKHMLEESAGHPSKYDESECGALLVRVLEVVQALLNRPAFAALVGSSEARVRELNVELVQLRALHTQQKAADEPDFDEIVGTKEKILSILRFLTKTHADRVMLLRDERRNDEQLAKAKAGVETIEVNAAAASAVWAEREQVFQGARESAWRRGEALKQNERSALSDLSRTRAVVCARAQAIAAEEAEQQLKLNELLAAMSCTSAAKKANAAEAALLVERASAVAATFGASRKKDEHLAEESLVPQATCSLRKAALESGKGFTTTTGAALAAAYAERLSEFKAALPRVHREHIACFAELYEELHVRAKNRGVVRAKNLIALAAHRREQQLAIDSENRAEAARSGRAAGELAVAIKAADAEIEALQAEVAELERRARASYETLEALGEPAEQSFAALVASIHARICREEQTRVAREIVHTRAGQAGALAGLLREQSLLEQNLARLIEDANAGGSGGGGGGGGGGGL